MINLLLKLHELSYGNNERNHYKSKNRVKWIVCVISFLIIRIIFFCYLKVRKEFRIPQPVNGLMNEDVIVSLTSFPARIKNVWMVIDSICRQKMRPSLIILYLASEEFPQKDKELPRILKKYEKYGLNVVWVSNNLKPHKKYFYAFQEYFDKAVITIDDDVYYRNDLISRLWEMSQLHKGCVCANRVTPILCPGLELKNYKEWGADQEVPKGVSFNYLAIGTCGVLYPPNILRNTKVFDVKSINKNCLKADDLWLKCHEILNNIPVATGEFYSQSIEIMGSQKTSLLSTNCDNTEISGNDIQWRNLDNEYHIIERLTELVKQEKHDCK